MIVPYAYEEIQVTDATPVSLTASKVNGMANRQGHVDILVTGYPVAYRKDGTAPTNATKQVAQIGDVIQCKNRISASQFQAIGIGAGGTAYLCATYFQRQ